jgi:hypothetical protein
MVPAASCRAYCWAAWTRGTRITLEAPALWGGNSGSVGPGPREGSLLDHLTPESNAGHSGVFRGGKGAYRDFGSSDGPAPDQPSRASRPESLILIRATSIVVWSDAAIISRCAVARPSSTRPARIHRRARASPLRRRVECWRAAPTPGAVPYSGSVLAGTPPCVRRYLSR